MTKSTTPEKSKAPEQSEALKLTKELDKLRQARLATSMHKPKSATNNKPNIAKTLLRLACCGVGRG